MVDVTFQRVSENHSFEVGGNSLHDKHDHHHDHHHDDDLRDHDKEFKDDEVVENEADKTKSEHHQYEHDHKLNIVDDLHIRRKQNDIMPPTATLSVSLCDSASESRLSLTKKGVLSRTETPADTAFARTKREQDAVLQNIEQARAICATTLDLSGKHLLAIPEELLQMKELEYLYLEGNEISFLPDEFFKFLPRLKWLDLRNNCLTRIPSIFLGGHAALRNLLLQNNFLKNLPLELGLVKTLHGLNITNNPLEFPPKDIIQRGTYEILTFLREMLHAKSSGQLTYMKDELSLDCIFEDTDDSSSSDDWNTNASMMELARQRRLQKSMSADTVSNVTGSENHKSKLVGPLPLSAELHREKHISSGYGKSKHQSLEKWSKTRLRTGAGSGTTLKSSSADSQKNKRLSGSSILSWKVNPYPEPPDQEYAILKMSEEREMAKVKEMKEKTDAILQKRKDDSILKNWREDAKKLQTKKQYQSLTKGTKEYPETAADAPFAVDKPYMKMLNNDERFKETRDRPRRMLSPASRARIEEEKATKIRELEQKIKDHTSAMMDRRRKPRGTPQEEMEAARRELEIAEDLHRQLMLRHKNVDYKLKEFEAEIQRQNPTGTRLKH